MGRDRLGWLRGGALVLAGLVACAAIAQAISHHSLEPIWTVGWIPAVLVASIGSRKADHCAWRVRRSSRR
jgi:hypothetical protein